MDQVSSLRQDRGVTVRTLATIRALRATEAKPAHDQPRFPAGDGQEKRSTSCQLRGSLTHPSVDAKVSLRASNRLCRRFQLSPLIRGGLTTAPRLAGPSHPSPPRPGVLWALFLATLALLVLQTTASANKLPLVRTRVTSQRTFRGSKTSAAMPSSKAMILPRGAMFQTAPRTQELTQEPLDFQTMKVIENWGGQFIDVLLVSGRNYVYMINASSTGSGEISYIRKLRWKSHDNIRKSCIQMRNEPSNCNNYIRIVEILDNGKLYICGTNAYNPKCRLYLRHQLESGPGPDSSLADTPFVGERSCEDTCGCPRIPTTSSAHLYTNTSAGYLLFSGVTPDYLGKKSFLMRSVDYLQSVEGVLNTPTFIKLIEYEDKVYLFFRETASRVETGTDSLRFYARVAQVCKDDMGGNTILENKWTTFIKARLECSIPGSHYTEGFTFNNLTSVSDITQVQMADGSSMDVVFATFTTPWGLDGVSMSSVCMFSMRESIQTLFDTGSFLGKAEFESKPDSNNGYSGRSETTKAVPIPDDFTPSPRPGSCHRQKSDEELAFIKKYPLMYSSVKPIYNQPIFTSESDIRVTQIALDNNAGYHNKKVLYLGTEKGSILRVRTRFEYTEGPKAILLEEMAFSDSDKCTNLACTVRSLHVTRPAVGKPKARKSMPGGPNVFVAFTDRITMVPVAVCISYGKEDCCNADPDCGWGRQGCQQRNASNYNSLPAINNLALVPSKCEVPPTPPAIVSSASSKPKPISSKVKPPPEVGQNEEGSTQSLATGSSSTLVLVVACVLMLLLGMAFGALLMHCRQKSRGEMRMPVKGSYQPDSSSRVELETLTSQNKSGTNTQIDYLEMGRGPGRVSPKPGIPDRPTTLVHHQVDIANQPYAPLTPSSMEDVDAPSEPPTPKQGQQRQGGGSPLHGQTLESSVFDEIAERCKLLTDEINEVEERHPPAVGYNFEVPSRKEDPRSITPPPLPIKQKSIRLPPVLPPPPVLAPKLPPAPGGPKDQSNSNNNNAFPSPPASMLLRSSSAEINFPPPPKQDPEEKSPPSSARSPPPYRPPPPRRGSKSSSVSDSPTILSPRSPPPFKPPPPRAKGIKKYPTFSDPHGQRMKPPVLPKSRAALARSASLRSPPAHANDPGTNTLPLRHEGIPERIVTPRQRPPSFRHNSNVKTPTKNPVPVKSPIVPGL